MVHRVLNSSNVLGAIAFLSMIASVISAEWAIEGGGQYWAPIAFVVIFAGCAYLSIKEDGKKR